MGMVVAARHIQLDTSVAIKYLLPRFDRDGHLAARFRREARAAAQLDCPHVARVIDVGELPSGSPYMVMERLDGEDLDQVVKSSGPLDVQTVCRFGLQVCEALAAAHARGIVHRDIKPANLFLTHAADGSAVIKVLDFGISKNVAAADASVLTKTDASLGSPLYMSPEQMRSSRDVDHRTDIWSFGVVLFQLLTGDLPFTGGSMPELCAEVLQNEAPLVTTRRGDVPEPLAQLIARCLHKDPLERPADVGAIARVLASLLGADGAVCLDRVEGLLGDRKARAAGHVRVRASDEPALGEADTAPGASRNAGLPNARDGAPSGPTDAPWSGGQSSSAPQRASRAWGWLAWLGAGAGVVGLVVIGGNTDTAPPSAQSADPNVVTSVASPPSNLEVGVPSRVLGDEPALETATVDTVSDAGAQPGFATRLDTATRPKAVGEPRSTKPVRSLPTRAVSTVIRRKPHPEVTPRPVATGSLPPSISTSREPPGAATGAPAGRPTAHPQDPMARPD